MPFGKIKIEPGHADEFRKSFLAFELRSNGKKMGLGIVWYEDWEYPHARCMAHDELQEYAPYWQQDLHDYEINQIWAY